MEHSMPAALPEGEYVGTRFKGEGFANADLSEIEFYNCTFTDCVLQTASLRFSFFEKCRFERCNMTLAEFRGARMVDGAFKDCKLLGINWGECGGFFRASFTDCLLDEASFANMNLQRMRFTGSTFRGGTFSNTNLSLASFEDCDLEGCRFSNANLYKTDFTTARNYFISAEDNTITKAKFSLPEAVSLLRNFDITLV
jgi:uncharacterized protein YjbI with pentapeptide repeats